MGVGAVLSSPTCATHAQSTGSNPWHLIEMKDKESITEGAVVFGSVDQCLCLSTKEKIELMESIAVIET